MLLNFGFSMSIEYTWIFLLLFPLSVIPFSYVTSFIFTDDTSAQITTLFFHFNTGALLVIAVYIMESIPVTAVYGDSLRLVGLLFPSFCVTHAIFISQNLTILVQSRNSAIDDRDYDDYNLPVIPDDPWAWFNLKGDFAALVA